MFRFPGRDQAKDIIFAAESPVMFLPCVLMNLHTMLQMLYKLAAQWSIGGPRSRLRNESRERSRAVDHIKVSAQP